MKPINKEKGQIFVLLALGAIVFIGFTALAIDGGMVFAERRQAQNAADAGAMAGAFELVKNPDPSGTLTTRIKQEAVDRANENYQSAYGTIADIQVNYPYIDNYHIQVILTTEIKTTLIHFVYSGDVKTTVEAVSEVNPGGPFAYGMSIFGMNETAPKTVVMGGNVFIKLIGGGIFSNSEASTALVKDGTKGTVEVVDGEIGVVGGFADNNDPKTSSDIKPWPVTGKDHLTIDSPPIPQCDLDNPLTQSKDKIATLEPGYYPSTIKIGGNEEISLESGLYCFGDGIKMTGGKLISKSPGVMIYIMSGNFEVTGGFLELSAILDKTNAFWKTANGTYYNYAGFLIFIAPEITGSAVKITGMDDGSSFMGTIYSQNGDCAFDGNANIVMRSQLVCDTVKVTGSDTFSMYYVSDENHNTDATTSLVK